MSTARDRVWALMNDGEWHPASVIASAEVGGSEGLRRLRELRKDGLVVNKRRISEGSWEYRMTRYDPALPQGKMGWGNVSKDVHGSPPNPLTPAARGQAMAAVAWAMTTMAQWNLRLHWCVDLRRDVGEGADTPLSPTKPDGETQWGQYLLRFRDALNNQKWESQTVKCHVALTIRYTSKATGQALQLTFDLPWVVNLARLTKAPPPVGVWRLVWEPQREPDPVHGHRHSCRPFEGDTLPDSFWYDGIPF